MKTKIFNKKKVMKKRVFFVLVLALFLIMFLNFVLAEDAKCNEDTDCINGETYNCLNYGTKGSVILDGGIKIPDKCEPNSEGKLILVEWYCNSDKETKKRKA